MAKIFEFNPSNRQEFFDLLNIDKAIEITLKEYEALRAEILQNLSDVNQRILLGLAAIFTIASLGLAPLAGFLTSEDIKIVSPIEITKHDFLSAETESFTIEPSQTKSSINRTTNEDSIKEGIIPSLVIFNWSIPFLSLYFIYRSLDALRRSKMIGLYISHRIEKKLIKLIQKKAEIINFQIDNENNEAYREHLTHISWENYIIKNNRYLEPLDINLIFWIFTLITFISLIGGLILCDYFNVFNVDIFTSECAEESDRETLFFILQEVVSSIITLATNIIDNLINYILRFIPPGIIIAMLIIIIWLLMILMVELFTGTKIIYGLINLIKVLILLSILIMGRAIPPIFGGIGILGFLIWVIPFILSTIFLILLLRKNIAIENLGKEELQGDHNLWFYVKKFSKIILAGLRFYWDLVFNVRARKAVNEKLYRKLKIIKQRIACLVIKSVPELEPGLERDLRQKLGREVREDLREELKLKLKQNLGQELKQKLGEELGEELVSLLEKLINFSRLKPEKLPFLLTETNIILNKIDNFISRNENRIDDKHELYSNIDSLLLEILTLQSIYRWNNPEVRFDNVFDNVLDEMWKKNE